MPTVIRIDDYITTQDFWGMGFITPKMVREQLEKAEGDVRVDINSGGGSVFAAWEIINMMEAYDRGAVNTRITGMAASAAGQIFLAGEEREVSAKTYFMAHPAWVFMIGDQYELRSTTDLLEQIDNVMIDDLEALTGLEKGELADKVRSVYNLIGKEIKNAGLATKMVKNSAEPPAEPLKKALEEDGEGEEQSRINFCAQSMYRELKSARAAVQIKALHAKPQKDSGVVREEKFPTKGGREEVTEKELNDALAQQKAEFDKQIEELRQQQSDAIKQQGEVLRQEQERSRLIRQYSGGDVKAANEAIDSGMALDKFLMQQIDKRYALESKWAEGSTPENDEGLEESIPASHKDPIKGKDETYVLSEAAKKAMNRTTEAKNGKN